MKLHEYMGKELFRSYGIPVPEGRACFSPEEAETAARAIGPVVVKSQILSGKRGKSGGIRFADTPAETRTIAADLLGSELRGYRIEAVLVEEKLSIDRELYLAITLDRERGQAVVLASAFGGMDIEDVPPEGIATTGIDPVLGLQPFQARELAEELELIGSAGRQLQAILLQCGRLFREADAELVEINPLVLSGERLIAADAKVTIDDDALYRQADLPRVQERSADEDAAGALGLAFVELDGDIGVMANGAGITMATLDMIAHFGGAAANFLDAGGGAGEEATARALELVLARHPRSILINIFGGITRCDDVARAIASVKRSKDIRIPMAVRLVGTNQEEGWTILEEAGIRPYRSMEDAARAAVTLAGSTANAEGEAGHDAFTE